MSLLLTLNRLTPSSSVFTVNFEQVTFIVSFGACWDNNNNDDNRHDEDVDGTDIKK